jgi:hypothetical protein
MLELFKGRRQKTDAEAAKLWAEWGTKQWRPEEIIDKWIPDTEPGPFRYSPTGGMEALPTDHQVAAGEVMEMLIQYNWVSVRMRALIIYSVRAGVLSAMYTLLWQLGLVALAIWLVSHLWR